MPPRLTEAQKEILLRCCQNERGCVSLVANVNRSALRNLSARKYVTDHGKYVRITERGMSAVGVRKTPTHIDHGARLAVDGCECTIIATGLTEDPRLVAGTAETGCSRHRTMDGQPVTIRRDRIRIAHTQPADYQRPEIHTIPDSWPGGLITCGSPWTYCLRRATRRVIYGPRWNRMEAACCQRCAEAATRMYRVGGYVGARHPYPGDIAIDQYGTEWIIVDLTLSYATVRRPGDQDHQDHQDHQHWTVDQDSLIVLGPATETGEG